MSQYLDKPLRTEAEAKAHVIRLHDPFYLELRSLHERFEALLTVYAGYDKSAQGAQRAAYHTAELSADTLRVAMEKLV